MNEKIMNALQLCVDKDDFAIPYEKQPFFYHFSDGRKVAVATDGRIMLIVNKTDGLDLQEQTKPNIEAVLKPCEYEQTITTAALKAALDKLPHLNYITEQCPECGGSGEVEWEYKNHVRDFCCPVCDGEGSIKKAGRQLDGYNCIDIGAASIFGNLVESLVAVLDALEIAEIPYHTFDDRLCLANDDYHITVMGMKVPDDGVVYDFKHYKL